MWYQDISKSHNAFQDSKASEHKPPRYEYAEAGCRFPLR